MCVRRGGVCHSADGTDDTVQSGMCEAGGEGGRDECGIHKQPLHLLLCLDDDSLEGSYCGAKDHMSTANQTNGILPQLTCTVPYTWGVW